MEVGVCFLSLNGETVMLDLSTLALQCLPTFKC